MTVYYCKPWALYCCLLDEIVLRLKCETKIKWPYWQEQSWKQRWRLLYHSGEMRGARSECVISLFLSIRDCREVSRGMGLTGWIYVDLYLLCTHLKPWRVYNLVFFKAVGQYFQYFPSQRIMWLLLLTFVPTSKHLLINLWSLFVNACLISELLKGLLMYCYLSWYWFIASVVQVC